MGQEARNDRSHDDRGNNRNKKCRGTDEKGQKRATLPPIAAIPLYDVIVHDLYSPPSSQLDCLKIVSSKTKFCSNVVLEKFYGHVTACETRGRTGYG
jgi:hypothetical protein